MLDVIKYIYQFRVDAFAQDKQRKIRTGNLLASLGVLFTAFFGLFYYLVLDSAGAALLIECFAGCYLFYFYFLARGMHLSAIAALAATYLSYVFLIVVFFSSPRSGFHFYYFLSGPFLSIVTLRGEYRRFKFGIVVISLVLFLLCELVGDRYALLVMAENEFKTLYLSNMVLLFALFLIISHALKKEIDDREAALETHVNRLTEVNLRLEQEVAERRRAEGQLAESRKKLELALAVFGASFWEWSEPSGCFRYDAKSYDVLGYARDETDFSIDWLKGLAHPESLSAIESVIDGHLKGAEKHNDVEFRIKDKAGEWRWVESAGLCVQWDKDSRPLRVIGIHRDISRRKERAQEREKLISKLQAALAEVKTLSGLLPICSSCKKIRDDKGYWNQIEGYIQDHSEAEFSHGICPDCARRLYPDIELDD